MYPHQHPMFAYTLAERHPALFVQMRLGKNIPTIRRILLYVPLDAKKGLRVLVVAPNSALGSWESELEKEGQTSVARLQGTAFQRLKLLNEGRRWNLINPEGTRVIPELAWQVNWDAVVVDESHIIKNPKAKVTQYFLKNFRDCPHRWALTGTPNPESDLEFWCQLAWLHGTAFGYRNYWDFRIKMFQPDFSGYNWIPRPGAIKRIREDVAKRCYILRRQDLKIGPEHVPETRYLTLPKSMKKDYDKAERDFELPTGEKTVWATQKYIWLRYMAHGWGPSHNTFLSNHKIEELWSLLEGELAREQVVVWFGFNHLLHDARWGRSVATVTGKTPPDARERIRKQFIDGKIQRLFIQQAVAQMGMDLSCSDTNIYFDLVPSSTSFRQTRERIVTLKKKWVLSLYLVTKDTVDEDIYLALSGKMLHSDLTMSRILKEQLSKRLKTR